MAYNHFDIPIFQKTYDLYKLIHKFRNDIPKMDRYTVWQKAEETCLAIIENLLQANQTNGNEKVILLTKTSNKVDLLRVFIRLSHETKIIDEKKYLQLQSYLDEIGRMLGGWIKNTRTK
jgi:four helix bundle protein